MLTDEWHFKLGWASLTYSSSAMEDKKRGRRKSDYEQVLLSLADVMPGRLDLTLINMAYLVAFNIWHGG